MHKQSTFTYILLSVIVVLGALVTYSYYQKQLQTKTQTTQREFLSSIPVNDVTTISLIKKDATITLSKQNDAWVISSDNNTPADSTAVSQLLSTLNHATIQAVASRQGETQATTFGLTPDERLEIVLKAGEQTVTDVYVGKIGAVPQTFYAQKMGEGVIYLINGARYSLDKSDWKQPENPDDGKVTNTTMPVTPQLDPSSVPKN